MTREEAILEARRMYKEGKFRRKIAAREPDELRFDWIILECGHRTSIAAWDEGTERNCQTCAEEWVRQSAGERKTGNTSE